MTMMTSGALPCVECGTTGGYARSEHQQPLRARGCCTTCYVRLYSRDAFTARHARTRPRLSGPCLSCGGTTPLEARGLCATCYKRAHDHDLHRRYPACGAVPVPRMVQAYGEHPATPAALTPEELGRFLVDGFDAQTRIGQPWGHVPIGAPPEALPARWQSCPPRLASAPTATVNREAHRRILQAERDAAAWRARRGERAA
jgi:hypothetical protein